MGLDFPQPIADAFQRDIPAIRAGLSLSPLETRALAVRVLAFDGSEADPLVHGAFGAFVSHGGGRAGIAERLASVWIARHGIAFALRAAVAQRRLSVMHPRDARKPGGFDLSVRWIEPRKDASLPSVLDDGSWELLRSSALKTKKDDRARVVGTLAELREGVPAVLACWIDGLLPTATCAAADLAALAPLVRASPELVRFGFPLVPALDASSAHLAADLLGMVERDPAAIALVAPYAKDFVRVLGPAASPPLTRLLQTAHAAKQEARCLKRVAEALLDVSDDTLTSFFNTMLESKVLRPVAARYMQLHPTDAVGALGQRGKGAAMLRELAQANPTAVREALTTEVDESVRKSVEKTLRQTTGAREAEDTELPWVLREPPWRRSQARPPMTVVSGLAPLDFEEHVLLVDGDADDVAPDSPVALLARDGVGAIGSLVTRAETDASDELFFALRRIESPRVAWPMALARRTSRRPLADMWLGRCAHAAAVGLLPLVLGPSGREQATASAALLSVVEQGRVKAVRKQAARFGEAAVRATEEWLGSAPLLAGVPTHTPRLPAYADVTLMPRIALRNGHLLPTRIAAFVVEMMYFSDPEAPYAGLDQVSAACDPRTLDAWLSALMHAWEDAGASPAGAWVLAGMARLGSADATRELSRSIKTWARKSETRGRALLGLDALAAGNAAARAALGDFARKGLRGETAERATELVTSLARKLHLSEDDLADMLVPSFDFDEHGKCLLDFGPRRFDVTLDDHLAPRITDEQGQVVHGALKARKTDDPVKARTATEQLKSLKKALGDVASAAVFRLELGMVTQRRYRREVFDTLRKHPVLGRLVRRLLWSLHDPDSGERTGLVQIAADGALVGDDDREVTGEGEVFTVAHRLTLDEAAVARWSNRFAEYELVQPFPQLGRATFTPTPDERLRQGVCRFEGIEAAFMAICGRLESRGWQRQAPEERMVHGYAKRFGDRVAYYAFVDPIVFGEPLPLATRVGTIRFREPLEVVGPLLFSEAAYDLHVFAATA